MDRAQDALRRYLDAKRDEPFSASQAADALALDREMTRRLLQKLAKEGEIRKLPGERYIFTTSADRLAYNMLLAIAPNISFEEYVSHRDAPHVLVRMSRDREVTKMLGTEER
ncbi:MAG: hypothetical protein AB1665_00955 [Candidatus Thermoplasmatota archaeon]